MKKNLLTEILIVRIPAKDKQKLDKIAREKGIGTSTLARMWLMEKLSHL